MTALPHSYKDPLLTLQDVSMQFGSEVILRDLNVQVLDVIRPGMSQGQVVGIYGRSGIGKSVLCRLLAGLAAFAFYVWRRNMLLTILFGMLVFTALRVLHVFGAAG